MIRITEQVIPLHIFLFTGFNAQGPVQRISEFQAVPGDSFQ